MEIFVICPYIPILLFFKRRTIRCCFTNIFNFDFPLIIRLAVERRINIDEVDFPAVLLQQMAHNLEIITPENLVDPSVLLLAVGLPQLCGIILRGALGALARPAELREPLYRRSLFKFKSKLLIHCYQTLHRLFVSAIETEVTASADLRVIGTVPEILLHDLMYRIIE